MKYADYSQLQISNTKIKAWETGFVTIDIKKTKHFLGIDSQTQVMNPLK